MGSSENDARVLEHLQALSPENYQRQKIQQEIDEILDMAATSAPNNKILLKELQRLKVSFDGYNQYIDNHIEKAISYVEKTPKTERAKKRRDVQTESLVRAYLLPKQEYEPESFTPASRIQKK